MPRQLHRLIVIDGDPAVRDSLTTLMGLDDHQVLSYATGAAFLRDLDDQPIDCVICEADLPDQSGLTLFALLHARHPETRFALLASRKDPSLLNRARALGIRHIFVKPLVHRSLLDFVMAAADTPQ